MFSVKIQTNTQVQSTFLHLKLSCGFDMFNTITIWYITYVSWNRQEPSSAERPSPSTIRWGNIFIVIKNNIDRKKKASPCWNCYKCLTRVHKSFHWFTTWKITEKIQLLFTVSQKKSRGTLNERDAWSYL